MKKLIGADHCISHQPRQIHRATSHRSI